MKHLLIILISILLLSSPLFGHPKGEHTLYRWETSSGHKWLGFGEKETHTVYKGQLENGKPNGLGIMTEPNGEKYVGEWKNGKQNGQGTYKNEYGSKFVGEFRDEKYWEGTLYTIEGKIKGKFENGQVTLEDSSQRYVGEYKNGKRWNGKLYHLWKGNVYDEDGTLIYKYVNGKEIKQ